MDRLYSFDWYDGIRGGVATYNGQPCYFESQCVDIFTQGVDWFKLSPISNEAFEQEIEQWTLWRKYDAAFRAGLVGAEHHPFLPEDGEKGEELQRRLNHQLVIDENNVLIAQAEFFGLDEQIKQADEAELEVRWTILSAPPSASWRTSYDI
ncbi:hypothetical protein [Hymenobacter sp. CRA2]|uniref:hypothetical protein n=1 Tax=Hymenobacter sp. CRA2 TaxID=1955620 RepID=UPI0009903294|nr:hypothetical protein [Hymenobacter sp. CRA2]OON69048.1 hypothetical protein B0919_10065 [Hymenobacter sp. CRA2]